MYSPIPSVVVVPDCDAVGRGIVGPLRLRRVWPRDVSSLALQYVDTSGAVVPAVWCADEGETRRLGRKLDRVGGLLASGDGVLVGLHPNGADPRLPALGALLERPGATLVSHRPGRRAVVRLEGEGSVRYAKVLRPGKTDRVVRSGRLVESLDGRAFDIAAVDEYDPESGVLVTHLLHGICMHDIPRDDDESFVSACGEAGRALRSLHQDAPAWLGLHDSEAEIGMLEARLACVGKFVPELYEAVKSVAVPVFDALRNEPGRWQLIHRDFYDKQIIVGLSGRVGVLDFDTLGAGEPALDIANMLAHLELRMLQGSRDGVAVSAGAREFLRGYGEGHVQEDAARIAAYLDASRLRLACLYAFWPEWAGISRKLVGGIGRPHCGGDVAQQPRAPGTLAGRVAAIGSGPGVSACPRVFVVGCPRSGTTMLERMLDAHPDLAMAHETHWITKYGRSRRDVSRKGVVRADLLDRLYEDPRFLRMAPERSTIDTLVAASAPDYPAFVRLVYDLYRRSRGKTFVGDKSTGGYLRNLPRLHEACPESLVLHLIRDGRDVCLSMLTWPKAHRAAGRHRLWEIDPVAATAVWWRWHVRSGIEDGRPLGSSVYQEIRYEELVADPSRWCAEICRSLGLAPDAGMAAFYEGRAGSVTGRSANASWMAPTPGLRDWRTQMPDEAIETFEAIAGDTLSELGYERRFPEISRSVAALAVEYMQEWESQKPQRAAARPQSMKTTLLESSQRKGETE